MQLSIMLKAITLLHSSVIDPCANNKVCWKLYKHYIYINYNNISLTDCKLHLLYEYLVFIRKNFEVSSNRFCPQHWTLSWRQLLDTAIAARQVGWPGRPWYYIAGTDCLLGFNCKYHGAHIHLTSIASTNSGVQGVATAISAWKRLTLSSNTALITSGPSPSLLYVQRAWDDQCCKVQSDSLLDAAIDHVVCVRLLAACSP